MIIPVVYLKPGYNKMWKIKVELYKYCSEVIKYIPGAQGEDPFVKFPLFALGIINYNKGKWLS